MQHVRALLVPFYFFIWNDQIEEHLMEHGVTPDEYEEVVCGPDEVDPSHSSDRLVAYGETSTGKYLACIYELLDETTILPITAYEVED
jgi:uncharacterized DUF497 family protein